MDEGKVVLDAPPRRVFADVQRWYDMGVSVPQVVQLARALPDIFQGSMPLSVAEAHSAIQGTSYAQTLLQRNKAQKSVETHTSSTGTASSTRPLLSWENVHLSYGANEVLKDVSVNIASEEWLAVIGPNGSGKTSLASLAIGFQPPTHGLICYKGKPVAAGQVSRQSESMAYLFQAADNMLFGATVEQEFLFGVKHHHRRQKEIPFSLDQLLQTVDLEDYRHTNPFHLSFGQRKRLAIGALLTRQPELLILDEPTTGQDEKHAHAFLQFLQLLRERNKFTYIMITHDMRAVAQYASRVVVLNGGHIVMNGHPEVVFARVDELAQCGILPPPIAQLHARLCEGQAARVALSLDAFLRALQPAEVTP